MRLDHVALAVSDRERSRAFYGEHFGFAKAVHDDAHLLILRDASGALLALSDSEPVAADPGTPRTTHFGCRVDTTEEVLAARERFAAAGVPEAEFEPEGVVRVQVFDPDGYRVEVYAF